MASPERPVYKTKKNRVRRALSMYYGMGAEPPSTVSEISNELNVTEKTVRKYINETPMAEAVEKQLDQVAAQTRKEIVLDLRERLEKLRRLESELMDASETVVTGFSFKDVKATVKDTETYGLTVDEANEEVVDTQVAVPKRLKQIPQFERLQMVWEEQRKTEDQISNLLGLKEPEEVEVGGTVTERKVWKGVEDDDDNEYPDQEVVDVESEDSI